jgi:hypothetical protein
VTGLITDRGVIALNREALANFRTVSPR